MSTSLSVGIIGAGVAGLTIARRLRDAGHSAVVLDKGRGVGGRASTRREGGRSFDHGAQYFTARDPSFRSFLDSEVPPDSYAPWLGRFARLDGGRIVPEEPSTLRYVGVPGMDALGRALALGLDVRSSVRATGLAGPAGRRRIDDADGGTHGPFDWVVATAPPPQSAAIFEGRTPIADAMARLVMMPCFCLMIGPAGPIGFPADGIRCDHPALGWVANDHTKPGRPPGPALVVHSSHAWASAHRDDPPAHVTDALRRAAEEAFGLGLGGAPFESLHRWLLAAPAGPLGTPCLIDAEGRLAACGDWCVAGKVEAAFLAGDACARAILTA